MNGISVQCLAAAALCISGMTLAAAADTLSCPYSAAELRKSLGIVVADGQSGTTISFAGGKRLTCHYNSTSGTTASLMLIQVVYENPKDPSIAMMASMRAGTFQKVPGDADGAEFQEQGDLTNATLHYLRGGRQVEARVTVDPRDASFSAIKSKLLKLRRIP